MAYVLCFAAGLRQYLHDGQMAQEAAEEAITISIEHGFPFWFAMGTCLYGWALAQQGQGAEGIEQGRQGIAAWRATGAELAQPHWLSLLAETYGHVGQVEAGLEVLDEALERVDVHGERYSEAKLHRLQGALLLVLSTDNTTEAQACFHRALDIAHRQEAKSLELRAAVSLSRLWQQQGKRAEACELLTPIYGWFTEGFDTPDLREAKALLDELGDEL